LSVTAFSTFTIWLIKTVKSAVGKTTYSALLFVLHKNITDVIYIHVPFCLRRCIYCDFYSTTYSTHIRQKYVESLCCELVNRQSYLSSKTIRTIYFGGGTPSQLTIEEIEKILHCIRTHYDVIQDAEITFEANPDDINEKFASELRRIGINRVSLGVQTFNNQLLTILRRRHSAEQAQNAVSVLQKEGIRNISIDLIYGLPNQSVEMFKHDLEIAFSLPIQHLSSYALSVEEGTALHRMIESKELKPVDEDIFIEEYNLLMTAAESAGFTHYEISNFALPGFESKHNSAYWNETPYLGCGPGAHSFDGKSRRFNLPNVITYNEQPGEPAYETEELTAENKFNERLFTSLRTSCGLDINKLQEDFPALWVDNLKTAAQSHLANKRMEFRGKNLCLTKQGIFVSDDIISDLMV
jgi:putative oxygen-independent coproporphyrinogen III oxidase